MKNPLIGKPAIPLQLQIYSLGPSDNFVVLKLRPDGEIEILSNPLKSAVELLQILMSCALSLTAILKRDHPIWTPHQGGNGEQAKPVEPKKES